MERRLLSVLLVAALVFGTAHAQNKFVERSTNIICLAPMAAGALTTVICNDSIGAVQLGLGALTALALNYGLEIAIAKERPDGIGYHSFPSTHTAVAFNGATFLMRRYGWKFGIPAYAVSAYVAWGRVYSNRHDWWDVLGGMAIGAGCALIYSRPFTSGVKLDIAPTAFGTDACGLTLSLIF